MKASDPLVTTDGPLVRLAAKIISYDGSLPSAIFDARARWKCGQTSNSLPTRHTTVFQGEVLHVCSDTDFNVHHKRHAWGLDLNIKWNKITFIEDVGYPHMDPDNPVDQRHLYVMVDQSIPESTLQALVGRQVRDLVELPPFLDEVIGWRKLSALSHSDPAQFVIEHKQWEQDTQS